MSKRYGAVVVLAGLLLTSIVLANRTLLIATCATVLGILLILMVVEAFDAQSGKNIVGQLGGVVYLAGAAILISALGILLSPDSSVRGVLARRVGTLGVLLLVVWFCTGIVRAVIQTSREYFNRSRVFPGLTISTVGLACVGGGGIACWHLLKGVFSSLN